MLHGTSIILAPATDQQRRVPHRRTVSERCGERALTAAFMRGDDLPEDMAELLRRLDASAAARN